MMKKIAPRIAGLGMTLGVSLGPLFTGGVAAARQPDASQIVSVRALALQVEADAKAMLAAAEMSRGAQTGIDGRAVGSYRWLATSAEKFRESLAEVDYREMDRAYDEVYPTLAQIPNNPLSVSTRDRLVSSVQNLERYFAEPVHPAYSPPSYAPPAYAPPVRSTPYERDRVRVSYERRPSYSPSSLRLAQSIDGDAERAVQLARTELTPARPARGFRGDRRAYRPDVRQQALQDLVQVSAAASALRRSVEMGSRSTADARCFEDLLRAHREALRTVSVFSGNVRAAFDEVGDALSQLRSSFHLREGEIAIRW